MMENSVVDFIQEIGYGFTSSPDECRNAMLNFNPSIKDMLSPSNVARILGMMARTHNNLNADWQVFINPLILIKQNFFQNKSQNLKYPNENWNENKELTGNTWNADVFVLTVQEMAPKLQWKDVVKEFDHAEFVVRDRLALKLIVHAMKRVLRDPFPIEHIYRTWKNTEGQVS